MTYKTIICVMPLLLFFAFTVSLVDAHTRNSFLRCGPTNPAACRFGDPPIESEITSEGSTACTTDSNGFFGESIGDTLPVNHFYQVETVPGVDENTMNTMILKTVENEVNNILLPTVFTDQCGASGSGQRTRRRTQRRRLGAVGMSTEDPDVVVRVPCDGVLVNDGDECFVVDGSLKIYYQEGTDTAQLETNVLDRIEQAMNIGQLDNVHETIVKVKFRDGTDVQSQLSESGKSLEDGEGSGDDGTDLSWLWALLGSIGALLLLWLGLRQLRKKATTIRRESMQAAEESADEKEEVNEDEDEDETDENGFKETET